MRFYILKPEVPGGIDEECRCDFSGVPPRIDELVISFDDWLGDDLLTTHPVFFVTEDLAAKLRGSNLDGYALAPMKVTRSELFEDIHEDDPLDLPEFLWLRVHGRAGFDDFGISDSMELVVSDRALSLLRSMRLVQCQATPLKESPTH